MEKIIPRGIRNNNPLNIRIGNKWVGEVPEPTDTEFEQFVSMAYGLRAGFILIRRYINRYGLNTVHAIISRWAPASENNTSKYIQAVVSHSGLGAFEKLSFENRDQMYRLVEAMVLVECGQSLPRQTIVDGYNCSIAFY